LVCLALNARSTPNTKPRTTTASTSHFSHGLEEEGGEEEATDEVMQTSLMCVVSVVSFISPSL
jgi:hypothetical protein